MKTITRFFFFLFTLCLVQLSQAQWTNVASPELTNGFARINEGTARLGLNNTGTDSWSGIFYQNDFTTDMYQYYNVGTNVVSWGKSFPNGTNNAFHWDVDLPDVGPTGTNGAFTIGDPDGLRLTFDNNEFAVKNGTANSTMSINHDGGNVVVSGNSTNGDFQVGANSLFVNNGLDYVGIGTITPGDELHIDGGGTCDIRLVGTSSKYLRFYEGTVQKAFMGHNGTDLLIENNETAGDITIDAEEILRLNTDDITRMTITKAGYVGIGTATPTGRLHILAGAEDFKYEGATPFMSFIPVADAENRGLQFSNAAGTGQSFVYHQGSTNNLVMYNSSSTDLVVAPGGNVGVNLSTPLAKLDVKSAGNGDKVVKATSSTGNPLFEVNQGGIGSGNFLIYDNAGVKRLQFAGAGKFFISNSSNVGIDQQNPSADFELGTENGGGGVAAKPGGGMWAGTSDRRSKSSVDEYTKGINELMQINPVNYTYNGKFGTPAGKSYVGVVAQELQEVVPSMVLDMKYNIATLEETETIDYDASRYEEDFLAVDPSEFLYMLINSTKDQQEVIETQQAKIADMDAELESVKATLAQIQAQLAGTSTDVQTKLAQQNVEISGEGKVAELAQNQPNPFNENTVIKYYLPQGSTGAHMNIFTSEGKVLKTVKITENGVGQINLRANSLPSGNYMYQLVTDAGIVGSKSMVLVK